MHKNTTQKQPKDKSLCSIRGIRFSAFLGGPLGAFYLISKNFETLGNKLEARKSFLYGIFSTALIFAVLPISLNSLVPYKIYHKIASPVIPLIYTAITGAYANRAQGAALKEGLLAGKKKFSKLKIIGVTLSSIAISLTFLFLMMMVVSTTMGTTYWLHKANEGYPYAEYHVGIMYLEGDGFPKNDVEGMKWLHKAAAQGSPKAQNLLQRLSQTN